MAFTYTHLTGLFSDQYLHEQAIYFGKEALNYYRKYEATPWHVSWMLNEVGTHYDMMCDFNSADSLYDEAINILPDTQNLIYRDISSLKAFLLYNKEKQTKTSLRQLKSLLLLSESEKECLARCAIIGEIFYREKDFDSAWIYLDRVYQGKSNTDSKKQAAEWMLEICKMQGRNSEVSEYASFLAPFATINESQGAVKSQLAELYNYYKQKEKEQQHNQRTKKQTRNLVVVITGLMAVTLCLFILYYRNKRKKQNIELQLKTERYAHEIKQKALSGRLKESNNALRDTLKRLEKSEAGLDVTRGDCTNSFGREQYETFLNEPVCISLLKAIGNLRSDNRNAIKTNVDVTRYKDSAMSVAQIAQLTRAVETSFPHLYELLKTRHPTLNRNEWIHCCLYLLQLDKMSICILLQEPYYTCRRCTMKLEEAFGCKQGLSSFLIEQAICQRH